MNNNVNFVPKQ